MSFNRGSKERLTPYDLGRFTGGRLFDRIGRAVCDAACLPRKELYEAWETARRVRRVCRGGRVVELAGGHGLLSHILLVLDDSSPEAIVVDSAIPGSAPRLHDALTAVWPRLHGRLSFLERPLNDVTIEAADLVVSVHACGALTDIVLDLALDARCAVAVLPCCHDAETCDTGGLAGWMEPSLAIDATRAARLARAGYRVRTQTIPAEITPKNRLLIGVPA